MSDTTHAPRRVAVRAETSDREAKEFVPFARDRAEALATALRGRIEGEVRFGDGDRALYATDASNYRQVPIGVVLPRSIDDVVAAMAVCRDFGAPVLSRGGGTSLAGQCCNVAVVIDHSKYLNRIVSLDPEQRLAWVEPGVVLDNLRDAAERHHLTFGPDPSTHDHNTLGGMIGNNSCGVHSVMAGRTVDNVHELEVLTQDGLRLRVGATSETQLCERIAAGGRIGEIYRRLDALRQRYGDLIRRRFPKIPRRVSGYSLDELLPENGFHVARALVGSEGTCVAVLRAGLRLVASPPARALAVLGFHDVAAAGDAVPFVLQHHPVGLEGMDQMLVDFIRIKHLHEKNLDLLPQGHGWLIAELGGDTAAEAEHKAVVLRDAAAREVGADGRVITDLQQQKGIWEVRKSGLGATAFVPDHPDAWPGWEDSAVAPDKVGLYLRALRQLFERFGYEAALYGHFGDGCIHCRINFGLRTEAGVAKWRRFLDEAAALVVSFGGSLSGEHGDGQSRAALLETMYGPELIAAFREFKAIWDPKGLMNPGKKVAPYPITSNLRLGPDYHPPRLDTYFAFADDGGHFAHAAMRCVGVGECRRETTATGVMCPSYRATREEKHSTRGRAHLLFEMLRDGPLTGRWKSDAVEEALDLCLGCKGCKSDCPVNVDMATYKAEFRAHHYRGKLRPRAAYSMGLIRDWARAASVAPGLANLLTQTPGISALAKRAGGIAPERRMPPFARETFRHWFARRAPQQQDGRPVILFPDTFNNYFRPNTAIAAVAALERAGCRVSIPARDLCCARPLYDWGMLDRAKAQLGHLLDTLAPDLMRGGLIVGLEPACVASLRDEVPALFPGDARAQTLAKRSLLLSEFLERHCPDVAWPQAAGRKAMVQIHCHHHAVLDPDAERKLLARLGVEADILPSGCCGMAGSFGFEAGKYTVSQQIAAQGLLPALAAAPADTPVLADGFSCREQIEQATGRRTLHVAEFIAQAL